MRLGIIACDDLAPSVAAVAGDYDRLYASLVALDATVEVEVVHYSAHRDGPPESPGDCDAWLIGGSRHGVGDALDWIGPLLRFAERALAADAPLIGVCFGHQVLGRALGAPVAPAPSGWTAGAVEYRLESDPPGDDEGAAEYTLAAIHRDQVLELPDGATLLASAPDCPVAAFTVGARVLAVQGHPEFTHEVANTLYRVRSDRLGSEVADRAVDSLGPQPLDHARVARWIGSVVTGRGSAAR